MKNIILIPNKNKDTDLKYTKKLIEILRRFECELTIEYDRPSERTVPDGTDLIIILGGDGTIMRASHIAARKDIPILPINLGRIGFMAELEPEEMETVSKYFEDDYHIECRMMLDVAVDGEEHIALNDAVFSTCNVSKIGKFSVYNNGSLLSHCHSDGIIIATPTGSTAYSMSAGGAIIDPSLECIELTTVCSHSLFSRPVILNGNSIITVVNEENSKSIFLSIDGRKAIEIDPGNRVEIKQSKKLTKLVRFKKTEFYEILSAKLNKESL